MTIYVSILEHIESCTSTGKKEAWAHAHMQRAQKELCSHTTSSADVVPWASDRAGSNIQ